MAADFGVIFVGGTPRQNVWWWPSFNALDPGMELDLIYVNRDYDGYAPEISTARIGRIWNENKISRRPTSILKRRHTLGGAIWHHLRREELPNKAFGAYAHYFQKYQSAYKYFAFVSDDVYLRRTNWLRQVYELFETHPRLGFVSPMLHNNPRHIRAPIWFGRTECLSRLSWDFASDHDGELEIAPRCVAAGYFGMQIGHKCDFAYDPHWDFRADVPRLCGTPMPMKYFELSQMGEEHFGKFFSETEISGLDRFEDALFRGDFSAELTDVSLGEAPRYQRWNVVLEIQPFHGLLYNGSLEIVQREGHEMKVFEGPVRSGPVDVDCGVYFGENHRRYYCEGITRTNPIAILKNV